MKLWQEIMTPLDQKLLSSTIAGHRSAFLYKIVYSRFITVFINFTMDISLLNPSKHDTNDICIITFNGALLHVPASVSHHQAKYNKPIPNY
jgi:hypothetical protein